MRPELEGLLAATLDGDEQSSWVLKHLLDNCRLLRALSPDEWEGQAAERTWPDLAVTGIADDLAFFLPTPAEFEEAKRRLRLQLVRAERLNVQVASVFHNLADRTVVFPLVDVLEGYDGDPQRYDEIVVAMNTLPHAAGDAHEADSVRARRALEHVRDVGGNVVERGYSLGYWANNALAGFGDEEADRLMFKEHPLPEGWDELEAERNREFEERFAAKTAEVLVTVDKVDEECASHLYIWAPLGDEGAMMGGPLYAVSGTLAAIYENFNPYTALRPGMWVSRLEPVSLARLFEEIAVARWQKPDLVQVLVKNDEPYFVLYMLRDGELRRCAPPPP
jgi:hypothetical protein